MVVVYWTESGAPRSCGFGSDALSQALACAEALRQRQRAGDPVSFVTIAAEHPDQVGPRGVDEPAADYAWVKRRPPPRPPSR
jgi:hypothetical protein